MKTNNLLKRALAATIIIFTSFPSQKLSGHIKLTAGIKEVKEVTLEEILVSDLSVLNNESFAIEAESRKIKTYLVTFENKI